MHDDRIRSIRHRSAGKNAHRFTEIDAKMSIQTSGLLSNDAQSFASSTGTGDNGVTIHRRVIEVRQRQSREVIFRRETIERVRERNLASGRPPNRFENFSTRFVFANHGIGRLRL